MIAIDIAGIISTREDIVDYPDRVGNITCTVAVAVAGFYRIGRIATHKDIIDYRHRIADIYIFIVIGVSADIIAGIANIIIV